MMLSLKVKRLKVRTFIYCTL